MYATITAVLLAASTPQMVHGPATKSADERSITASGCEVDEMGDATVRTVAGMGAARTVATLSDGDGRTLGDLCVALVRDDGGRMRTVARLAHPIEVPDQINGLSRGTVSIDPSAFRIAPATQAVGVRVSGDYISTSTQASWTSFHLLQEVGGTLVPILIVNVDDSTTDKTQGERSQTRHWSVRLSKATTRGAHDVTLTRKGSIRRFAWDGLRYVEAPPTRR